MLRKDWDDMADNGRKGDWYFHHNDTYITIRYGDEVMEVVTIPILAPVEEDDKRSWRWDGNKESPTVHPSIKVYGRPGEPDLWHGYLQAGKIVEA